jgi:hypothetical protein
MGRILEEDPMSNFVRAVSLSASGLVVVFGGFLILASAVYACPYGQSDRSGPLTLFRLATSFVLRLRPRRMLVSYSSAHSCRAISAENAKERRAEFDNDGAVHGLVAVRRRVASNAQARPLALTSREAVSTHLYLNLDNPGASGLGMKVGMICRWKADEFHTVESQGRRVMPNRGLLTRALKEKLEWLPRC